LPLRTLVSGVAQLDRAAELESAGSGFESRHTRQSSEVAGFGFASGRSRPIHGRRGAQTKTPAGTFSHRDGVGEPRKRLGAEGGLEGQPIQGSTHITLCASVFRPICAPKEINSSAVKSRLIQTAPLPASRKSARFGLLGRRPLRYSHPAGLSYSFLPRPDFRPGARVRSSRRYSRTRPLFGEGCLNCHPLRIGTTRADGETWVCSAVSPSAVLGFEGKPFRLFS
jgi:hypothetical protein